jgi:ATP-binding cassette subfamily B protein
MASYGIILGLTTVITQRFFDAATDYSNGFGQRQVIFLLAALVVIHIFSQILNGATYVFLEALVQRIDGRLSMKYHEKMGKIAPEKFEDTQMLDFLNKAKQGKSNSIWFVLSIFLVFTYYLPYYAVMSVYLSSVRPVLSVSLLLVFLPTVFTQFLRAKLYAKLEDNTAPVRREVDYYEKCITSQEYLKETRNLGAFAVFYDLYRKKTGKLNQLSFAVSVKSNAIEFLMKFISLLGYLGVLGILFLSLMRREISVGMFAAVFSSVGFMFSFMEELVNGHFGALVRNYGTVRNYLDFMEMPVPEKTGGEIAADTDIFLDHVSFTYPGTDRRAVSDVSLHIRAGETVAVVGENGSGKSTLIRLITGLYTPEQGSVSYGNDGKKKFKAAQKGISAVFQKYARYQMTLRENISISDTEAEYEDDFLEKCCEKAGVESGSEIFPSGYETLLSREFGGVDLSGGQWQRIAIARGFFRKHQLIVLDEPTAAIDPIEETRIYDRFAQMAKEKTAIIVTHRLGSVKLADRVFVMKDGRLVEEGTHEELMRLNGEYARLYRTQEKWYVAV